MGLPDTEVKEARERVRAAIINGNFDFPRRRITINLAPADLPKEGGRYDLPIALGILAASGQIPAEKLQQHEFSGELALDGNLRPCGGALPVALAASEEGRTIVLPIDDARVGALASGATVFFRRLADGNLRLYLRSQRIALGRTARRIRVCRFLRLY